MLQNDRINKELSQGMIAEEKTHQLVGQSPKKDRNPAFLLQEEENRCIENTRKRGFVLRMYRETMFVCEV